MGCHSDCQKYKLYIEEEHKRKNAENDSRKKDMIYDVYSVNKVQRLKNNKERYKK